MDWSSDAERRGVETYLRQRILKDTVAAQHKLASDGYSDNSGLQLRLQRLRSEIPAMQFVNERVKKRLADGGFALTQGRWDGNSLVVNTAAYRQDAQLASGGNAADWWYGAGKSAFLTQFHEACHAYNETRGDMQGEDERVDEEAQARWWAANLHNNLSIIDRKTVREAERGSRVGGIAEDYSTFRSTLRDADGNFRGRSDRIRAFTERMRSRLEGLGYGR